MSNENASTQPIPQPDKEKGREPSPQFTYVPGANPYEKGLESEEPRDRPKNGASDWW